VDRLCAAPRRLDDPNAFLTGFTANRGVLSQMNRAGELNELAIKAFCVKSWNDRLAGWVMRVRGIPVIDRDLVELRALLDGEFVKLIDSQDSFSSRADDAQLVPQRKIPGKLDRACAGC